MSEGNGLPPGWAQTTLGEAFKWGSGGTPQSTNQSFYDGDIPWVMIGDLSDRAVTESSRTITQAGLENSSAKWVQPGSVLIAMYGSIGKLGIAGTYLTTNQAIAFTYPHPIDTMFLFYYLLRSRSDLAKLGKGGTQQNISQTVIKAYPFALAPLAEQRRIVAAIEEQFARLDAGVAALERTRANLKRYRTSVLKAAVEGRLTEEWRKEHPDTEDAAALLERILEERHAGWEEAQLAKYAEVDKTPTGRRSKYKEPSTLNLADLPDLPDGWCWTRIDQIGEVKLGRQRSPQHHNGTHMRPYLRVANVYENRIDTRDVLEMNFTPEEYKVYRLEYGDILLNEGQSLELVGRPALYRNEIPDACFQNTLVRFRSHLPILQRFALIVFLSYLHAGRFQQIARWTTNIAHLGAGRFAELRFPLPSLSEQEEIVAEVERRLSVVERVEAQVEVNLKRAASLRQSILRHAFEGKLVPQDPNDEPACALLERIRQERTAKQKPKGKRSARPGPTDIQARLFHGTEDR